MQNVSGNTRGAEMIGTRLGIVNAPGVSKYRECFKRHRLIVAREASLVIVPIGSPVSRLRS